MNQYILLIHCNDQKGLIYKVTGLLYEHGCNIVSNGEFVDRESNTFFMRTAFEGTPDITILHREFEKVLPENASITLTEKTKKPIVIMATKEYHCLGDLLIRHAHDELNADILGVICNHESLRPLVEQFNMKFYFVPHENCSREEHEGKVLDIIDSLSPEYVVLAKYMRILTENFVSRYKNKIVNIHHSFLPAFIGAKPYKQAFDRGVKIIGATAHYVNDNLDEGPIITQSVIPVDHTHNEGDMVSAGRDVEKFALSKALNLILDDRVFVSGNKTILFD